MSYVISFAYFQIPFYWNLQVSKSVKEIVERDLFNSQKTAVILFEIRIQVCNISFQSKSFNFF